MTTLIRRRHCDLHNCDGLRRQRALDRSDSSLPRHDGAILVVPQRAASSPLPRSEKLANADSGPS